MKFSTIPTLLIFLVFFSLNLLFAINYQKNGKDNLKETDPNALSLFKEIPIRRLLLAKSPDSSKSANSKAGLANPASVYCIDQGGQSKIITAKDGSQSGVCEFSDGRKCDEWEFFRSKKCE